MDVDGLMDRTPSHVFEEWKSYHKMVRWGEDWDQAAQMTAVHCGGNKPISSFRPKYVPPAGGGESGQNQTDAILSAMLAANRSKVRDGGR